MDIKERITRANLEAVTHITEAQPYWVDIAAAGEVVDGLEDRMILHSGPPIAYEDMTPLHQRGVVSGALFEGWAATEAEAQRLLRNGDIKIDSALNHNTVGAGTGIITQSVAMMVVEDRHSGKRAATFPAEGSFQGGFCGWGLYSPDIAENLRFMRRELFPILRDLIRGQGGLALKPILAESMQMGDENHTRQSAADLLFQRQVLPGLMRMSVERERLLPVLDYVTQTPRFFHCFGQGASRAAMLAAEGTECATMVTAVCGNGREFGIRVAGLGDRWFTAPAPMLQGRYLSSSYSEADQLPWMGDSCVVECAGLGGMAAAASPIVCNLRGLTLQDGIMQTREMEKICITHNSSYPIPNMNFDCLPVGIDIRLVLKKGISPVIHGGMFGHDGGLIGAGSARIPMACFEGAMRAFAQRYTQS